MRTIKKWQEPIYAIGGFGPGFMYQLVLTYLLYFYRPAQARIETGALVFAPAGAYALGMLLARVLDGVLDIPIAGWTDNMKSRWGRRRPLMVLGIIPAIICFVLLWFPPFTGVNLGPDGHWANAVYIAVVSSLYFFFHTLIISRLSRKSCLMSSRVFAWQAGRRYSTPAASSWCSWLRPFCSTVLACAARP